MRHVVLLLVIGLALSGCTVPFSDGDVEGGFTRSVVFTVDPMAMGALEGADSPEDVLQAMAATQYTYTHGGGSVDVDGLTVRFTGEDGRSKQAPLSDYTTHATLSRGDSVVIDGVKLTSGISIGNGDMEVAREGVRADWLEAMGYPLPVAAKAGDTAVWAYDTTLTVDAGVASAGSMGETLRDGLLDLDLGLQGTFGFETRPAGSGMDMDVRLRGDGTLGLLAEASLSSQGQGAAADVPYGMDIDAEGEMEGLLALAFGPAGLDAATVSGRMLADGTVHVWDDTHLRSERWEPEDVTHPFIDGTLEPQDIPLETAMDVLETVVLFLDDLYAMDLVPGDSFSVTTNVDLMVAQAEMTHDVRITEAGEKVVAAGTFDALMVASSQELVLRFGLQRLVLPIMDSTVWLDRETYLPLAAESLMHLSFDADDLAPLVQAASAHGVSLQQPHLSIDARANFELQEHAGAPRVAGALLGAGNALVMPLVAPFGMMGAFGGVPMSSSAAPMSPPHPQFSLVADEAQDSLRLVDFEPGRVWDELALESDIDGGHVAMDRAPTAADPSTYWGAPMPFGPMEEGQTLRVCVEGGAQDVQLRILFGPERETVYQHTFESVAAC